MASVQKRDTNGHGSTWAVLFRDGSKQRSKTFPTAKAARSWAGMVEAMGATDALRWLDEGDIRSAGDLTLGDLAEKWFKVRAADVANGDLTPAVLRYYTGYWRNWIEPWLGSRIAATIDERDVQAWVDRMRAAPRSSAKTIADRHSVLYGIFKWGSDPRRALVPRNPCVGTELPKRTKKPPKGLRLPELHALSLAARDLYPEAADLIDFITGTGWRISEAMALTVGQVEDDGTALYVTMSRVWRTSVGFVDSAKSEAGHRRLRVLGAGVGAVRRNVVGKGMGDLVFVTAKGRPWEASTFREDYWPKILERAGLSARKPTPHWLRHSHVFVCHAAGMSIAEIQRRLGHASIKMTIDTYGQLIDDMSDDVAARLDAMLTPGTPLVVAGSVQPPALPGQDAT